MVDVATRPVRGPAFRLGRRARKAVLLTHIAAAGAWLGIDVVLGVMVGTALVTGDAQQAGVALQSLGLFAVWPLIVVGLLCLASGILLGAGSTYGLVRYWWTAIKLGLNVVLVILVLVLLRPQVGDVSAASDPRRAIVRLSPNANPISRPRNHLARPVDDATMSDSAPSPNSSRPATMAANTVIVADSAAPARQIAANTNSGPARPTNGKTNRGASAGPTMVPRLKLLDKADSASTRELRRVREAR